MKIPVGPTVMTVCCVGILAALGTWQVQRMHWKEGIIAKLNAGYDKPSSIHDVQLGAWSVQKDPLGYGSISGRLQRNKSILLGPRTEDGRVGYHLLIPVQLENGKTLIVNAGWVSEMWKDNTEDRFALLPMEPVTAKGVVHKPDWSSFASKNSPSNDMWFRADIAEIAKAKEIAEPYPFILYADKITPDFPDVEPHEERWLPRNKHAQYAMFWYALGVVMLTVYGFYVAGLNKQDRHPETM